MKAYSNNGMSFRAWNDPSDLLLGEVFFDHEPSEAELVAAFPSYATIKSAHAKAASIAALNAEFDPQRKQLLEYINVAVNVQGDAALVTELKAEFQQLAAEYQARMEAINNG